MCCYGARTSGRSPWGARHRAFQSEPLALVGKVYAWAWCLGCPRNAARAVACVPALQTLAHSVCLAFYELFYERVKAWGGVLPSYLVTQPGHSKREFSMGGADADGGCCTLKRGSGIFILVLSILSLVGSIICAVIAGFSEMPLYTAFGWIHFVLLIYLISAASAYVCCRACGSKITGGLAVG